MKRIIQFPYVSKPNFHTAFRANIWTCSHKNPTSMWQKYKEKQNYIQTHITVAISL